SCGPPSYGRARSAMACFPSLGRFLPFPSKAETEPREPGELRLSNLVFAEAPLRSIRIRASLRRTPSDCDAVGSSGRASTQRRVGIGGTDYWPNAANSFMTI